MKIDFSNKKKLILALCLAGVALTTVVGGTLAVYTSQVYQRSVVRNRDNQAVRFSSDKLIRVPHDSISSKEVYYPVAEGQNSLTFRICNYDQLKSTLVSEVDIAYTIAFEIEQGSPNFTYVVSRNQGDSVPLNNLEKTVFVLKGGVLSVDTYTVTFSSPNDNNNLKLTVTVTPKDISLTRKTILTATLIPIAYGTTQEFHAWLEFPDSLREKEDNSMFTPIDLDAYNILVSAAGGEGDVYILWDHTQLDMDYFFRTQPGVTFSKVDEVHSKIVLHMNSGNETDTYLIPFYSQNPVRPNWDSWSYLENYIKVGTVTP